MYLLMLADMHDFTKILRLRDSPEKIQNSLIKHSFIDIPKPIKFLDTRHSND